MTRPNKKAGAPREIRTPALPRFSAYLLTLQLPLRFVYYAFFRCFLCPRSSFRLGCLFRFCFAAPLGLVLYVDLLAPYVLLDDLLVLDDVLADPYLLLDHRPLLYYNLFLDHRYLDLVFADLGF